MGGFLSRAIGSDEKLIYTLCPRYHPAWLNAGPLQMKINVWRNNDEYTNARKNRSVNNTDIGKNFDRSTRLHRGTKARGGRVNRPKDQLIGGLWK